MRFFEDGDHHTGFHNNLVRSKKKNERYQIIARSWYIRYRYAQEAQRTKHRKSGTMAGTRRTKTHAIILTPAFLN